LDKSWDLSSIDPFRLELCKLVLVKAEEWQYEREWRCIYRHGNRLVDYPGKLKSIIWGMRMSEEDKIAIRDILKNSAVIFRRAKRSQAEFRIAIEPEEV
jgi:hypothetical protein